MNESFETCQLKNKELKIVEIVHNCDPLLK